jgi:hypothetical protein
MARLPRVSGREAGDSRLWGASSCVSPVQDNTPHSATPNTTPPLDIAIARDYTKGGSAFPRQNKAKSYEPQRGR